jgi:hypothetical protein
MGDQMEALGVAISALQAQDSKTKRCATCKHNPPSKKWPCVDCDMREPADRWEPKEVKNSTQEAKNLTQKGLDTISRTAAIDALVKAIREDPYYDSNGPLNGLGVCDVRVILNDLPSAQPEPLSDAYMNAVWTWLLDYQIKAAELKGRYTPYEVLSWVANDWRKEHEGSD